MKFRIRFADQIVGVFIILAILSVVLIIVILGSSQRWFARSYTYKTSFDSAVGLSPNMAVQYKGFAIGKVKSFKLTADDRVEVTFVIHDTYIDRVKQGSLVEVSVSPIGLGNQFRFYPGLGTELLEEGDLVPSVRSPEAQALIQRGLTYLPSLDDSVTLLLKRINGVLAEVENALWGTDTTTLGRTLIGMEETVAEVKETVTSVKVLPGTVNQTLDTILGQIKPILADINRISTDINQVTEKLSAPEGMVSHVLDGEGTVYTNLESSIKSLSKVLQNLDKTTSYLPGDMPQVASLLTEIRTTVKTAEDVLLALSNNPLLKRGIPAQVQVQSSGTNPRDISF